MKTAPYQTAHLLVILGHPAGMGAGHSPQVQYHCASSQKLTWGIKPPPLHTQCRTPGAGFFTKSLPNAHTSPTPGFTLIVALIVALKCLAECH